MFDQLLRCAIVIQRQILKETTGVWVNYHSIASGEVYLVRATMDSSAAEAETSEGIQFTEQVKDFEIDTADLPVMWNNLDKIEVLKTVDGNEQLGVAGQWYQVLSEGGARAGEPLGNYEDTWLLHTKNIPEPVGTVVAYGNSAGDGYGNQAGDMYGSANR